jgi:hypothetical protein
LRICDVRRRVYQLNKDHLEDLWWYQVHLAKVEVVSMLALWLHVCCMF